MHRMFYISNMSGNTYLSRIKLVLFVIVSFALTFCVGTSNEKTKSDVEKMVVRAIEERQNSLRQSIQMLLVCDSIAGKEKLDLSYNIKKEIAKGHLRLGNHDSAMFFIQGALKEKKSTEDLGDIYDLLSNMYINERQLDSAEMYSDKALNIVQRNKFESELFHAKTTQGRLFSSKGSYEKALKNYFEALDFFMKKGNTIKIFRLYINIGNTFVELKNYQQARTYYHKALKLVKKKKLKIHVYEKIGTTYRSEKKLDSALIYLNPILALDSARISPSLLVRTYLKVGAIYMAQNKIDQAKSKFKKSLELSEQRSFIYWKLLSRFKLTHVKIMKGNYDPAIQEMKQLALKVDSNNKKFIQSNYFSLYRAYQLKGDHKQALFYYELYTDLKDSLSNVAIRESSLLKEKQFQAKLKDKKISYLQQSMQKDRLIGYGAIGILMLGILLLLFIILWIFKKRAVLEKEKQLDIQEKQLIETKLASQSKELASNLLHLASMQELAQQAKEQLKNLMDHNSHLKEKDFADVFEYLDTQNDDERWREFYERFDELEGEFIRKLTALYPNLSAAEIRLCSLLRLNLSSKDIAFLTSRSLRTVENIRFRLRKKMNLEKDIGLVQYILSI